MTTTDLAKARELFCRGCDLSPSERTTLLDEQCAGDEPLRSAVEALFAADSTRPSGGFTEPGFIANRLLERFSRGGAGPSTIGPYRIVRVLGEGSMGVAYLARQTSPEREVAVKVLRPALALTRASARFDREIRILGRLAHPGIARIYEAGTDDQPHGPVPYYAMEFIDGPRITDYADQQALNIDQRADLVIQLADAVQYAHSRGVIHRDLKPANILMRGAADAGAVAQPAILDFGVARVLDDAAPNTLMTETGSLVGTLGYMSPEQLGGNPDQVDARCDVYALGVILYELLSGHLPHDVRGRPLAEAARIVRSEPSVPLASHRGPQGAKVPRDLAVIVEKAIDADPERRYATAAALADDLRRFLSHEPILARPATVAYQLATFARRHTGLVAGCVLALVMLVAGLAVSLGMYVRAERQRERADEQQRLGASLREFLVQDVLGAAAPDRLGADVPLVEVLLAGRSGLHERFINQPAQEADVHVTLGQIFKTIGRLRESAEELEAALPLLEQTSGPDSERTIEAMLELSATYTLQRRLNPGMTLADSALERARRVPAISDDLMNRALRWVGHCALYLHRYRQAANVLREALTRLESQPQAPPTVVLNIQSKLIECLIALDQRAEADAMAQTALQHAADVDLTDEDSVPALQQLMHTMRLTGRDDEALRLAERLAGEIANQHAPARRGIPYLRVSQVFKDAQRYEQAAAYGQLAAEAFALLYPVPVDDNQHAASNLVEIYRLWPGHERELREWTIRSMHLSFMKANAKSGENLIRKLEAQASQLSDAGIPCTREQLLDWMWERRDEAAPPKHPQRAMFCAQVALVSAICKHRDAFDLAIKLAADEVPFAKNPSAVRAVVDAARAVTP